MEDFWKIKNRPTKWTKLNEVELVKREIATGREKMKQKQIRSSSGFLISLFHPKINLGKKY